MTEVMNQSEQLMFVKRVSELPLVNSTASYVNSWYQWSKEKNQLVRYGCGMAEKTIGVVSGVVKPYMIKIDRPIHYVDELACKQLQRLELNVPALKKTPAQIRTDVQGRTQQVYDNVKTSAITKTSTLATGLLDTCLENRFAKPIVGHVLDYVEVGLDKVMPTEERPLAKGAKALAQQKNYQRMMNISHRTYKRLEKLTAERVDDMRNRANSTVHKLREVTELVHTINIRDQAKDTYEAALTRLNQLWKDLGERYEIDNNLPLNQKIHLLSLRLTHNVTSAFHGISTTLRVLPERFRSQLGSRLEFLQSLRSSIEGSVKGSGTVLYENSHEKLTSLVQFINEWSEALKARLSILPAAWKQPSSPESDKSVINGLNRSNDFSATSIELGLSHTDANEVSLREQPGSMDGSNEDEDVSQEEPFESTVESGGTEEQEDEQAEEEEEEHVERKLEAAAAEEDEEDDDEDYVDDDEYDSTDVEVD